MGEKRMENFALEQVRPEDRKGWISLAFVQMGMIICVPSLLLGRLLSLGMPLWKAIASGTAGYLLTVLLSFPLGMQGADLGIPSVRIAASTFGRKGARFLIGTVMLVSAVFGMNALRRLDACSLPLLAAIMIGGTVMAFARYGTGGLYAPPEDTMTFVQGVGLSFSFTAAAAVTCADITRFQKNRKETVKSVFWGVMPAGIFTLCLGVLITKATGDYDITTVLASVGLPVLGYPESLLAFRTLEEYFGKPFFGVVATELGGANTAYALHIACQLGLPIIDGDPAGRSVPELQHSSFYVEGIPMAPVAVATQFGDTMIIKDVVDDMRCEDMIRALAVASGNKIGVADHAVTGEQLRHSIIPHTLSYAMEIGRVLRLAREDGKVLFSGKVSKTFYEEEGAFILGEIHLSGTGDYKGESYGI